MPRYSSCAVRSYIRSIASLALMIVATATTALGEYPVTATSIGVSTTSDRVEALAMDAAGNIYSIQYDGEIDKWPADGTNHTRLEIPGVHLTHARGIAIDDLGNLYLSDTDNGRVLKVTPQYNVTTINGFSSPKGMAGTEAGVVVTDDGNNTIKVIDGSNQVHIVASGLDFPVDIARDKLHNKFYYVLEHGDDAGIYSVNGYDFDHATAIAGSNEKNSSVGVDGQGNVFYRQIQGSLYEIPFGKSESVGAYGYTDEHAVIGNALGAGYIAYFHSTKENLGDTPSIQRVVPGLALPVAAVCPGKPSGSYPCEVPVEVFFTTPQGGGAQFSGSVTISADSVTAADYRFVKLTCSLFGDGCHSARFIFSPKAPGLRRAAISIKDDYLASPSIIHIAGSALAPIATFPTTERSLVHYRSYQDGSSPALDLANNLFYDAAFCINKVPTALSTNQTVLNCQSGLAGLEPGMMAVDEMGDVFYALPFYHAIAGTGPLYPQSIYISGIEAPTGVAFDSDGDLLFSDFQRNTVSRYSFADQSRTVITSDLRGPEGLAIDTMGALYIADSGNKRIVKIPKAGPTTFLTQNVGTPLGVAVDVAGNLFVSDTEQQKTIELPVDGSPAVLLSGDLRQPNQVAVGWNGDFYVANGDIFFSRLYRLQRSQPQPILFEKTTVGNASSDSPRFFSISNGGNESMMISGLSVDNADFSVVAEGGGTTCLVGVALAAGHTCQVGVNYRPLHQDRQGLSKGSLTVSDDSLSAASMQIMQLSGSFAVPPLVDPSLSFQPASGKVSIYKTPLYLNSHSLSPAQVTFKVVSGPAHLNADASGQHYLTFAGVGSVVIEADQPATNVYAAGSIRNTLVVALPGRLLSLQPTSSTRAMLSQSGASFTFLLTPEVGSLLDSVQLTLDGLPSGMTYTMTPPHIDAGSGPTTITLNVVAPSLFAGLSKARLTGLLLGVLILPLSLARSSKRIASCMSVLALFLLPIGMSLGISGCGSSHSETPTYAITVNAVSEGQKVQTTVFVQLP